MPKPDVKSIAARFILLSELQSHSWIYLEKPTPHEAEIIHQDRLADLRKYGLWSYATNSERELLETPPLELGLESAQDAFYSSNAQAVFAWCLGMIDGLPPFDTAITDEDAPYSEELVDHTPFPHQFEYVADNCKRRLEQQIEWGRTEAELWHWRSRTLEFQRSKPVARSPKRSAFFQERIQQATKSCVADGMFVAIDGDFPAFGKPYSHLDDDEWRKIRTITEQRHKALNWVCGLAPENNYDETPTDT